MAKAIKMGIELFEDLNIESMLSELDWLVRGRVLSSALRKAAEVVKLAASPNVPRSSITQTAKKKSQKQKRADQARVPLADAIGFKVKNYGDGQVWVAIVGAEKQKGRVGTTAHSHLLEYGHRAYYWSDEPATRKTFVEAKRWLAPAVDSTKAQQQDAIFGVLKSAMVRAHRKRNKKTVIKQA